MLWFDLIDIGFFITGALFGVIIASIMCVAGNESCEECRRSKNER